MKEAIILAGGFGTRLQGVVNNVPKPMAPVNGLPFLVYLLKKLAKSNIEHVILSTGYLHENIKNHFGGRFENIRISYSIEDTPLGTGGAIALGMKHAKTDSVFVLNGDTFFDIDLSRLEALHTEKNSLLTIALREVDDVSRYGSVITDENGKITAFTEKNALRDEGFINGGIYAVNKNLFTQLSLPDKFSFEKDILEKQYKAFDFYGKAFDAYFIDIGIPEDYNRAQSELPTLEIISNKRLSG